jgi:hypothetical protein
MIPDDFRARVMALEARLTELEREPRGLTAVDVLKLIEAAFGDHVASGESDRRLAHRHTLSLPLRRMTASEIAARIAARDAHR